MQLQQAYTRFQGLPPERREELLQRYQHFQQLPPAQRERVLNNYHRWQQMTPQERGEFRHQWHQNHPPGGYQWHPQGRPAPAPNAPRPHGHKWMAW